MGDYKDKKGTTRVGDFLRTIGPAGSKILRAAGSLTGQPWMSAIAGAIGGSTELTEEQRQQAQELLTLDVQDLANARQHDVDIQTSEHSSKIAKVFPYMYDVLILLAWTGITAYITISMMGFIEQNNDANMSTILGIYSGVTALATQIIQFHRGSSRSSQLKDIYNAKR